MEEQAGNLATAVSIFKLSQQADRVAVAKPVAKPAAKHAALSAPRTPATIHQRSASKPKAAGSAGEEWTEFWTKRTCCTLTT